MLYSLSLLLLLLYLKLLWSYYRIFGVSTYTCRDILIIGICNSLYSECPDISTQSDIYLFFILFFKIILFAIKYKLPTLFLWMRDPQTLIIDLGFNTYIVALYNILWSKYITIFPFLKYGHKKNIFFYVCSGTSLIQLYK